MTARARIAVGAARPQGDGWALDVRARGHAFAVTLRRADLERWAPPGTTPERVVEAAFEFLLANEPVTSILSSFDCSVIRSYFPEVDRELPRRL